MSTLISLIAAYWLTVLSLATGAAFTSPWRDVIFTVPAVIMLAVTSSSDTAIRFAAFCGIMQAICFPSQSPVIAIILIAVAVCVGTLYRVIFSIPSTGALTAMALVGSIIYEIGRFTLNIRMFYEIGFPDWEGTMTSILTRLIVTTLTVLIGGAVYRNAVVRFRQAFVGNRGVV